MPKKIKVVKINTVMDINNTNNNKKSESIHKSNLKKKYYHHPKKLKHFYLKKEVNIKIIF